MTLRGVPVLQYDGLGVSLPADVDDRLASHWVTPVGLGRQLGLIREFGHRVVRLYDAWARGEAEWPPRSPVVLTFDDRRVVEAAQDAGYQAVCASRGWPARPGAAIVNRVTVLRDTTELQFSALLARQPRAYVPAVARTLLARLQRRAARTRSEDRPVLWGAWANNSKGSS